MSGLDLQEALAKAGHMLPVIFLSGHGDIPTTVQVMRGGAEDFLTKTAPKEELIYAVKRAFARDHSERAERARMATLRAPFATLTPREREVLKHVVEGKLNKQIAYDLGIHERTVKLHPTAITTKLGVHSTAELTKLWMEVRETRSVVPDLTYLATPNPTFPKGQYHLPQRAVVRPTDGRMLLTNFDEQRNIYIAVVDDDESIRRSLRRLLRAAHFQPIAYPSAEAFLADQKHAKFDRLVFDIQLGGCPALVGVTDLHMPGGPDEKSAHIAGRFSAAADGGNHQTSGTGV
ncbi:MAG: LuxR C-terminal-related transcriptional regulator [Pyrinomonadaceae bacterium]|nr:LuxR C-terminal-related transcriptional regulator [Pyrinomonadaceae bacterium]